MKKNVSNERYIVPSLISAGKILKYLSKNHHKQATLGELSQRLDINKSTCYRLLHTLTHMSYLNYDIETKTYSLGSYLVVLGKKAEEFIDYIPIVKKYLKQFVLLTKNTTALVQRIGNEWVYVDKEEPSTPVRVTINIGQSFKLNSGATGKLFLAYMEPRERERIIDELGLIPFTDKTITDREEFNRELEKVRKKNYSVSLEEHYPGIDGISVPIFDRHGKVQMAITTVVVHTKKNKKEFEQIAESLKEMANELSEKIYF